MECTNEHRFTDAFSTVTTRLREVYIVASTSKTAFCEEETIELKLINAKA
jgi:hypothetical protein